MYDVQVKIKNQWHDLTGFDDYDAITDMGKVQAVKGLPDGLDLEDDFDTIQEWLSLPDDDQDVMLAYYEANSVFDWEEAQAAFVGRYANGADFAEEVCSEVEYEALESLPDYLRGCIDWQAVWDTTLHYDYFEQDGMYFSDM